MYRGLLLDNLDEPAESSYEKLRLMGATAVGTLWTGGTRHRRAVYERCESLLGRPVYLVRVGGHRQKAGAWLTWAGQALAEVPQAVRAERRLVLVVGNEPNLEGWADDMAGYAALYRAAEQAALPVAAAAPGALHLPEGRACLEELLGYLGRPRRLVVNLYAETVGLAAELAGRVDKLYIGEVNTLETSDRAGFLRRSFAALELAGARAALVFIAGGKSWGAWDEGYIISEQEARALYRAQGVGMLAVDWSVYQDPSEEQIAGLPGAGVGKVILQLGGEKGEIDERVHRWITQSREAGLSVEAYLPPWWAKDATMRAFLKGKAVRRLGVDRLWIDVEHDTVNALDDLAYRPADTVRAVVGALIGAGWPRSRLGIYASPYSWQEVMGDDQHGFSHLALWLTSWRTDGTIPENFDDYPRTPFGGWMRDRVRMQQYSGTTLGPTGFDVDLNWCPG